MVEETRCEREIALAGKEVGDLLDVLVDAENLLNHHDAALWRACWLGEVSADFAGRRLKTDIFAHENNSLCSSYWTW